MAEPIFRNNAYWVKKEDEIYEGPYCMTCYDKDRELIRLAELDEKKGDYNCAIHGPFYHVLNPYKNVY